jgi:16S rRNA (guanine966-N2)-methyltransferase
MIKILAGQFKGRVLKTPKGQAVRPTTARVRQRLFDVLASYWVDSIGVDAFSGSGSIGFEALSRGAVKVYATEKNALHARLIQQNAETLKLTKNEYTLENKPFEAWWKAQSDELVASLDWVFVDPPYGYEKLDILLESVLTHPAFQAGALVIVEHGNTDAEKAVLEKVIADDWASLYRVLDCGDSSVWILEKLSLSRG